MPEDQERPFKLISCAYQNSDTSKRSKLTIVEAEAGDKAYTGFILSDPARDVDGKRWKTLGTVWLDDDALDKLRDHIVAIRGRHAEKWLQEYREELERNEDEQPT